MINLSDFISHAVRTMKSMEPGDCATYRTFKKDRSVTILRTEDGFKVTEDGFANEEWCDLDLKQAQKLLRKLKSTEFPRSNKIHVSLRSGNKR